MKHFSLLFIFSLFFFSSELFGQSLSIDETVEYINSALRDHPRKGYVRSSDGKTVKKYWTEISLLKNGTMTQTLCYDILDSGVWKLESSHFNVSDIDYSKLIWIDEDLNKNRGSFKIVCKSNEKCISIWNNWKYESEGGLDYEIGDAYENKKVENAYRYLFTKIQEDGTYHRIDNDPFAPQNTSIKTRTDVITVGKTNGKISLIRMGGLFTVKVKIGLNSRNFIIDSGASDVCLTEELEKELIAQGVIAKNDYLTNGLYKTANGAIQECRRLKLKKLIVGTYTVLNVTASVGNNDSPLLLGKSFLDKFKKWSIDNENEVLNLEK